MNLSKIRFWPYICLSTLCFLLTPVFFPSLHLSFFVPCLIVAFYQKKLIEVLWLAFGFGLLLDLSTSHSFFGLYTSSYCLAVAILYPQKKHFFADYLTTLPVLTFLAAALVTLVQATLFYMLQKNVVLGGAWFLTDILVMPLLDACYAFIIFLLPSLLFGKQRRYGSDYFLQR